MEPVVSKCFEYIFLYLQLMSKMAPLLGREMSERLFLKRYSEMCTDPLMHVRKVCNELSLPGSGNLQVINNPIIPNELLII